MNWHEIQNLDAKELANLLFESMFNSALSSAHLIHIGHVRRAYVPKTHQLLGKMGEGH